MSREDEIVYLSLKIGPYTYQVVNQDLSLKEWMIRKVWDGGSDELGPLVKENGPDPSYFTNPLGRSVDGTIMWHTMEDAVRFAARGFR
ncbi:hypothetical protein [Paenarthrobacter sp. AMU7]|uniref:Uncharacterized protein n=1 Tax=Paenarthrobacter sp. AMU7 TaxID=3162492 RepID=A0AB39YIR6_9MICC